MNFTSWANWGPCVCVQQDAGDLLVVCGGPHGVLLCSLSARDTSRLNQQTEQTDEEGWLVIGCSQKTFEEEVERKTLHKLSIITDHQNHHLHNLTGLHLHGPPGPPPPLHTGQTVSFPRGWDSCVVWRNHQEVLPAESLYHPPSLFQSCDIWRCFPGLYGTGLMV